MDSYLGIDGGGSKTRALLVDTQGRKLHYAEAGPSNLNAYDEATVRSSLSKVVDQCIQAIGALPSATCMGLAGAGNSATKKRLEPMVLSLGLVNTRIVSDAEIALEGSFSGGPGILLVAGTGSVCLGKSSTGKIIQCGGWGWLADDAGSAGWIGLRALETAVQQYDGRLTGHALQDAVFAHLEIQSSEEISSKIYQPVLERSKIAELSQCVLDLADAHDPSARWIYNKALDALENLVRATAEQLQDPAAAVVLAGGLLAHNPTFRQRLESRLPDFKIQEPQSTQLDGAVAIARKIQPVQPAKT